LYLIEKGPFQASSLSVGRRKGDDRRRRRRRLRQAFDRAVDMRRSLAALAVTLLSLVFVAQAGERELSVIERL